MHIDEKFQKSWRVMGCVYFEWSNKDKELLTAYETVSLLSLIKKTPRKQRNRKTHLSLSLIRFSFSSLYGHGLLYAADSPRARSVRAFFRDLGGGFFFDRFMIGLLR